MNRKQLPAVSVVLRPYQQAAIRDGIDLINDRPTDWHAFIAPTGTGKSVVELGWLRAIPDSILITPRLEIIAGMLEKVGATYESENDIITQGAAYGLFTPIRLRNLLAKGQLPFAPTCILLDECHHSTCESWDDIQMYLNGVPVLGATATFFRGTPKGTEVFRKQWHTVNVMIDLISAIGSRYCSLPTTDVWPLIDDDLIDVVGGEFKASTTTSTCLTAIDAIVERCRKFYSVKARYYDIATMFAVPSTTVAHALTKSMNEAGLPAVCVTQATSRADRKKAFELVVRGTHALVQISVVSEGVDLPIHRLIDLRPTMSPVVWLQQVGRIMRPSHDMPEYISCCRNLERHCYLMEGLIPDDSVREAQEAFTDADGNPIYSTRTKARAIGLEGLGKFVATPIYLLNGLVCSTYNLVHVDGYHRTEYFVLVNPNQTETLKCRKVSKVLATAEGLPPRYDWGKWEPIAELPELKGCTSAHASPLTEKQQAKWIQQAESRGLNPHVQPTNRMYQILPVMWNLGIPRLC